MSAMTGGQILHAFIDVYDIPYIFGNPGTTETGLSHATSKHSICFVGNGGTIIGVYERT